MLVTTIRLDATGHLSQTSESSGPTAFNLRAIHTSPSYEIKHALTISLLGNFQERKTWRNPNILRSLKIISPPIDSIRLYDAGDGDHDIDIINTISSLQPRSLEIHCGFLEEFSLDILETLSWSLEILLLSGLCTSRPRVDLCQNLSRLGTLILLSCFQLHFRTSYVHHACKLRHVEIIENDVVDMFIALREAGIGQNLVRLYIHSGRYDNDFERYDPEELGPALLELSLESLDLVLTQGAGIFLEPTYSYLVQIPRYFPPNIKDLRFRGPLQMAGSLDVWSACVARSGWLPVLEVFSFRLDSPIPKYGDTYPAVTITSNPSVAAFIDLISAHRPEVKIIYDNIS